jgi:hypothetical protein
LENKPLSAIGWADINLGGKKFEKGKEKKGNVKEEIKKEEIGTRYKLRKKVKNKGKKITGKIRSGQIRTAVPDLEFSPSGPDPDLILISHIWFSVLVRIKNF